MSYLSQFMKTHIIALKVSPLRFILFAAIIFSSGKASLAEPQVKIGVISCLTGQFARIGQDAVDAVTLASENLAKEQNINVTLITEDDGFAMAKSLTAYRKLTSLDHIDALVSVSSTSASAINSYVKRADLPTAQVFLETNSYIDPIVQLAPNMDAAEIALGAATKKITKGTAVLIVPTNDTWLRLANAFEKGFGPNIIREEIPVTDYDLRSLIVKVRNHNPERVILLLGPEQGPLVLKELLEQLPSTVTFAFDANFFSGLDAYKKALHDLSRIMDAPVLVLPNVENKDFRINFKKRFGRDAGPWTEYSYDAYTVLIKSYNPDRKIWIKNMHDFNSNVLTGKIKFDDAGVRDGEFEIKNIKDVIS